MAARSYVVDIAGGTATATVQIQATQTLRSFFLSALNAAAGKIELSMSSTSQIGTAQPDANVLGRFSLGSAAAGNSSVVGTIEINQPVKAFQSIYIHCTGTGNLGTAVIR
jgi:hypothetical protein